MRHLGTAVAVAALYAQVAHAGNLVDQSDENHQTYLASFNQVSLAQSFKTDASNVSGASVFLQNAPWARTGR